MGVGQGVGLAMRRWRASEEVAPGSGRRRRWVGVRGLRGRRRCRRRRQNREGEVRFGVFRMFCTCYIFLWCISYKSCVRCGVSAVSGAVGKQGALYPIYREVGSPWVASSAVAPVLLSCAVLLLQWHFARSIHLAGVFGAGVGGGDARVCI